MNRSRLNIEKIYLLLEVRREHYVLESAHGFFPRRPSSLFLASLRRIGAAYLGEIARYLLGSASKDTHG